MENNNSGGRMGWIPYWNLWPLKCELAKHGFNFSQTPAGDPTQINKWLQEGKIQLAPCSSVCLIKNAKQEMALPLGVVADGEVKSVYLGFLPEQEELYEQIMRRQRAVEELFTDGIRLYRNNSREFAQFIKEKIDSQESMKIDHVPMIKMTPNSESSSILSRLLFKLWFPRETYQLMLQYEKLRASNTHAAELELVIGDEALYRRAQFSHIIDLGALWKKMTDLPFVFAVWQTNTKNIKIDKKLVLELAEIAENRMRIEPTYYMPSPIPKAFDGQGISLAEYWKNIYYRIGPKEMQGLITYLCLVRSFDLVETNQSFLSKIIRWQSLSQTAAGTFL